MGTCYLDGIDVEVDLTEAYRLLSAAAKQEAARAMANLAYMYAEGLGTKKNIFETLQLYLMAAQAGEFVSQVRLVRVYSRGVGVTPDPAEAAGGIQLLWPKKRS